MLSEIVRSAIAAIWLSYDPDTMQRGFDILRDASAAGDADAMCFLGRCYLGEQYVWSGGGFPENDRQGLGLIAESVKRGSSAGLLCAMRCGVDIKNAPITPLDAFNDIKVQADAGDFFCAYIIANAYFWGDILEIYPDVAKDLLDRYGSNGLEEAYNRMAYPLAVPYYEQSFESGLSSGFGNYMRICETRYADIDQNKVFAFLKRLAQAGSPVCCADYGVHLEYQHNDAEGAFRYTKMAYDAGDKRSAYRLAGLYGRGYGVERDLDKAFELYKEAADAGNTRAYFFMANYYFEGRGSVAVDYREAMRWLRRAYNVDGDWRAAAVMGVLYQGGLGVAADDATAFRYLRQAEAHIDDLWYPASGRILNALGVAYAYGRGVGQNIPLGAKYLDMAIENDSEEAREHRKHFKKTIFGWRQK